MFIPKLVALSTILAAVIVLLAGCTTPRTITQIETKEVLVPVVEDCAEDMYARPEWPDNPESIANAPNAGERIRILLQGILTRDRYINDLEANYSAC